jgi:hypothetical protein
MTRPSSEIIFAVEEAPEGGYLARALGHDIFTEADTLDALRDAVRDAVRCHLTRMIARRSSGLRSLHDAVITTGRDNPLLASKNGPRTLIRWNIPSLTGRVNPREIEACRFPISRA